MRLFYFAKSRESFCIVLVIIGIIFIFGIIPHYRKLPEGGVRQFNRQYEPYENGSLRIGGKMPWGPGDSTFAPYLKIPASQKFYISIAEPDNWCINEDCNLDGAFIQTLGGWLQVEDTDQAEVNSSFGLNLPEHNNIKSIIIIGDNKGKIIGIYPNKGLKDILGILKNYTDLADFDLLSGVSEFGKLKVGSPAPLKPGDSISHLSRELSKFSITNIPEGKKFYLYGLQKKKYDIAGMYEPYKNEYACIPEAGCRYPEPDPPHDFLFDTIDQLGGWFLANDDGGRLIEAFGLDPNYILSGKLSLVVLIDAKGVIVALHPHKTLSDALTILSQHPDLADIYRLYQQNANNL